MCVIFLWSNGIPARLYPDGALHNHYRQISLTLPRLLLTNSSKRMEERCRTCNLCSSHYRQISLTLPCLLLTPSAKISKEGWEHVIFVLLITGRLASLYHAYSSPLQQRESKGGWEHVVFVLLIRGRLASLRHTHSSPLQQREWKTGVEHVVFVLLITGRLATPTPHPFSKENGRHV